LDFEKNLQQVKINVGMQLVNFKLIQLLKEFKGIFVWTYKNLKGIPHKIVQHQIELNTSIPLAHQASNWLNPNYEVIIK
jgi:hypothetical protein